MLKKYSFKTLKVFLGLGFFLSTFTLSAQHLSAKDSLAAREKLISYSKQFVGTPYLYGGTDKYGIDCSGLIYTVARESIRIQLPRTVSALYSFVRIINEADKEPGDLVFFKTTGSKISHVGLYIGNEQFIHAASDGPNTGVIVSSLKESYWKQAYSGAGQFLPATKGIKSAAADINNSNSSGFWDKISLEGTLTYDWNFFTYEKLEFNFRGITLNTLAKYTESQLQPGIGFSLGYDPQMNIFRIPVVFSLNVAKGLSVYAGPVFSFGNPVEPGTKNIESPKKVKPVVFPGIIGTTWQTPSVKAGKTEISLVQDLHYSVYNNTNNSALPFINSLAAGLVFSTGIRVTIPLSNLL